MRTHGADGSTGALHKARPKQRSPAAGRPLIVELVGLAGAGKTTVLHAIQQRDETVRPWRRFERLRSLPMSIRHIVALAPTAFELLWTNPRSCWPCTKHLLRLRTFHTMLAREATTTHRAIILDEGPVYSLCRLRLFQKASLGNTQLPKGWRSTLAQGPGNLDVVFWLDAPDPLLAQRIRSRVKTHDVKHVTDREVFGFLERWRCTYREILSQLPAESLVRVVEIDTSEESADHVAGSVLAVLSEIRPPRGPDGES